jgi:hypothetical protein
MYTIGDSVLRAVKESREKLWSSGDAMKALGIEYGKKVVNYSAGNTYLAALRIISDLQKENERLKNWVSENL